MIASVTRLTPRVGTLERATVLFREVLIEDCLAELRGIAGPGPGIASARAHLRRGDAASALRSLGRVVGTTHRELAEIAMLSASAHTRLDADRMAAIAFTAARAQAISSGDAGILAELELHLGIFALAHDDGPGARAAAERGLDLIDGDETYAGEFVPKAHVAARLHEMLGVFEAGAGRYGDFLAHVRDGLAVLDRSPIRDVYLEAYALRNLAILSQDFDMPGAREYCERANALPWTSHLASVRFTAIEATAMWSAVRGDVDTALDRLRTANDVATSSPERVLVAIDRSLISHEAGFSGAAAGELAIAFDRADRYRWVDAPGDSRNVLLALAQAGAATDTVRARRALDAYVAIARKIDPAFASRSEARVRAEEAFAFGRVLRAEGKIAESVERLRVAFETWTSVGYDWRAARAALELTELHAGDVFRLAVRRELIARPASVFSARARLVA